MITGWVLILSQLRITATCWVHVRCQTMWGWDLLRSKNLVGWCQWRVSIHYQIWPVKGVRVILPLAAGSLAVAGWKREEMRFVPAGTSRTEPARRQTRCKSSSVTLRWVSRRLCVFPHPTEVAERLPAAYESTRSIFGRESRRRARVARCWARYIRYSGWEIPPHLSVFSLGLPSRIRRHQQCGVFFYSFII